MPCTEKHVIKPVLLADHISSSCLGGIKKSK